MPLINKSGILHNMTLYIDKTRVVWRWRLSQGGWINGQRVVLWAAMKYVGKWDKEQSGSKVMQATICVQVLLSSCIGIQNLPHTIFICGEVWGLWHLTSLLSKFLSFMLNYWKHSDESTSVRLNTLNWDLCLCRIIFCFEIFSLYTISKQQTLCTSVFVDTWLSWF